ncbi:MAG: chromate transporter [Bryobacteraceae bacterium]
MNVFVLYLLLLKASLTSFSGLASLPMVRRDLVVEHKVLSDRQLNAAVVAGRAVPGPNGLYVVSVGYFVGGIPGAFAGWLAMTTPAFLIIPLLKYLGHRAEAPPVRAAIEGVIFAAAALILSASVALARDALHGPGLAAVAVAAMLFVVFTKRDTLWILGLSAIAGWLLGAR